MAVQPGSFFFLNYMSKPSYDASLREIAIWGDVLFFFLFCFGDLTVGKFGPHPVGVRGVNRSKWEVRLASGPS